MLRVILATAREWEWWVRSIAETWPLGMDNIRYSNECPGDELNNLSYRTDGRPACPKRTPKRAGWGLCCSTGQVIMIYITYIKTSAPQVLCVHLQIGSSHQQPIWMMIGSIAQRLDSGMFICSAKSLLSSPLGLPQHRLVFVDAESKPCLYRTQRRKAWFWALPSRSPSICWLIINNLSFSASMLLNS